MPPLPQVLRVVKAVRDAGASPPDAFALLGVAINAPAADVRKRYMKLSILIHPDKYDHPLAKSAFQASFSSACLLALVVEMRVIMLSAMHA